MNLIRAKSEEQAWALNLGEMVCPRPPQLE